MSLDLKQIVTVHLAFNEDASCVGASTSSREDAIQDLIERSDDQAAFTAVAEFEKPKTVELKLTPKVD